VVHYGLKEVTYFGLLQGLEFGRIEPKEKRIHGSG
jgi:hypothetical protein